MESLSQELSRLRKRLQLAIPAVEMFDLYGSEAHTTDLDFLHRHRGVGAEHTAVSDSVAGLGDWGHVSSVMMQPEQLAAMDEMRTWFD